MKGHGEKLSRKQEEAIIALLSEPTITQAADKVKVSESTLRRWLKIDEFKTEYREAKREAVSQAVSRLQQATAEAVDTLQEIMRDTQAPAPSRVNAAKAVLEMSFKGIELEDLAARVEELERFVEDKKQ